MNSMKALITATRTIEDATQTLLVELEKQIEEHGYPESTMELARIETIVAHVHDTLVNVTQMYSNLLDKREEATRNCPDCSIGEKCRMDWDHRTANSGKEG